MMAQGAGARGGRNDPLKTIPGARLKTAPSGWPELDSLERACWGGAKRSRSVDGQVRGGLAMLPAEESRQPGCFLAQTVQAPFVFDSAPGGMLYGAGLLWPHPTFQLCPHPWGQLYEEPSGETGATVAGDKHKPTVLVGNSATQARTQRTGAGCSVEDVRQQTHTRPATLDSVCWSAARVCKGSGHKHAAFGREYASTTSRPPGAPLNVTVNVWAPLTCTCVLKDDAVQPHGGCAMDGRVHRRGSTVRTSMVPVPERIRKYAELGQESTLHSPKFLLTPRCDILKQVKKRHDSKHNKQSRGPRQGVVPARCVKCQCGKSGVLGVPRQSEGDLRCVKCHREKPLLCPWATGPVLEPSTAFAQCVKCHRGETSWWGVPKQSEGDLRRVKCHRGKPLLCLWVSGTVLGPGAVLPQCVKCHCEETFWWGVHRQSEGDSRCVKCHRGKSILCPWSTGPVLGSGAVLAQCVKCHCGETCWWEVPRQSESVVSLRCVSVSVRVGISASVSISISIIASVSVSVSVSASASRSVSVSFSVSISDRVKEAGNKLHYTWLQHPIYGKQFELIFNVDSAQGTSGSAGLKFVALAGWATPTGQAKGLPTASETSCEPVAAQNVSDEGERSQRRKQ